MQFHSFVCSVLCQCQGTNNSRVSMINVNGFLMKIFLFSLWNYTAHAAHVQTFYSTCNLKYQRALWNMRTFRYTLKINTQKKLCLIIWNSNSFVVQILTAHAIFFFQSFIRRQCSRSKRIDVISRITFPLVFALFNLVYWSTYLFRNEDEE